MHKRGWGEGGGLQQIAARPRKPLPDHGVSLPIAINRSSNFRSKLAPGAITADGKPMADILDPMRRRALRHASPEGFETAIPRLMLAARSLPDSGMARVYEPVACLILQGAKQVAIGDRVLRNDHATYLFPSPDLPATTPVT